MSYDFSYCPGWTQERKDAEVARYRAVMKVCCLEKNIKNADYSEFDALMYELEKAHKELQTAADLCIKLRVQEPITLSQN